MFLNTSNNLNQVTTLSKILAGALFVALPFLGFYLGIQYQKSITPEVVVDSLDGLSK